MQRSCVASSKATIFSNPACIMAWRAEAKRIESLNPDKQKFRYIHQALGLLDELYCLQNPEHKNPLYMRQAIFAMFVEDASTGVPLAMFFEGLALKEGFGCGGDAMAGQALIRVASLRKCAEAINYMALCYVKHDIVLALKLLREAALSGHVQAQNNLHTLVENIRVQLARKRKLIEFSASNQRLRLSI